jgi:DNA-binding LacI/PurR family transcriptional regulator
MRLFAAADPPTAAFAANNLMSIGLLRALRDLGLTVPRVVSVVGFDDHLLADLLDPPLSVVDRDVENQGAVAMRMLLARLSGDVTGPGRTVRLDTRLIRRSSTTRLAPT